MFCVLCLTNTGFVQCYSLGSRKVCCTFVFIILLYSVIFCFACFASQTLGLCSAFPSAPVVCGTLFLLVIHVLCSLPHHHRVCAVLFPPLEFTPFCFSLFYWVFFFCYACFAQQAQVCAVIFSRAPFEFARVFFACIIQFLFCFLRSFPR